MAKKHEILKTSKRGEFSIRLIELRKLLSWSQARLAKEWEVHPGTIALWETGSRSIPGPVKKLIQIYESSPVTSNQESL